MKNYNEYEEVEEEEEIEYDTNATSIEIEIKGNKIYALLDTGSGKNVMTEKAREKLQLNEMKPSKRRFIIGDGKRVASKGKVKTEIRIDNVCIPMEFEVIESTEEDIILGTKLLDKIGNIDYMKEEATIYYDGQVATKPIFYKRMIQKTEKQNENVENIEQGNDEESEDEEEELNN
jgi:hypothetical protein